MSLDPDSFRSVLGRFASGVTVVTAVGHNARDYGMTVSAFCSLSLQPPLVIICIDHQASMHALLLEATHFVVNILAAEQEAIARRFAGTDAERFDGLGYSHGQSGAAILDDVLASIECRRVEQYESGDHTIIVAEAEAASSRAGKPLLYYRGGYAQLER